MIEYAKVILPKVTFSRELFRKELFKSIKWVEGGDELAELHRWCVDNFNHLYPNIISEAFEGLAA